MEKFCLAKAVHPSAAAKAFRVHPEQEVE